MNTQRITVILSLLVMLSAGSALAKEPFEPIAELTGPQLILSHFTDGTKLLEKTEFIYLGGDDLWLVETSGIRDVALNGFGSGRFSWAGSKEGTVYRTLDMMITDGPVRGRILDGNGASVGKFTIQPPFDSQLVTKVEHAGHWTGEAAFPGGARLPLGLQVAETGRPNAGCPGQSYSARIFMPGSPYMEESVTRCTDDTFASGDFYTQFFHYVPSTGAMFFVTLNGTVDYGGTVFQGVAQVLDIYGETGWTEGKFLLGRPTPFQP